MAYQKTIKPKAANDNRHDQWHWDFLHTYVHFWVSRQNIPAERWHFNRAIHYAYELFNRPWLPEKSRIHDLIDWLRREARSNGFSVRYLTESDL